MCYDISFTTSVENISDYLPELESGAYAGQRSHAHHHEHDHGHDHSHGHHHHHDHAHHDH